MGGWSSSRDPAGQQTRDGLTRKQSGFPLRGKRCAGTSEASCPRASSDAASRVVARKCPKDRRTCLRRSGPTIALAVGFSVRVLRLRRLTRSCSTVATTPRRPLLLQKTVPLKRRLRLWLTRFYEGVGVPESHTRTGSMPTGKG